MKTIFKLILALLLFPQAGWAQLLVPSFGGMRSLSGSGAPVVVPVKFKTETNPNFVDPDRLPPPHLTEEQLGGLIDRMIELEEKRRGMKEGEVAPSGLIGRFLDFRPGDSRLNLSENHIDRAVGRLAELDRHYVDAIPKERWDEILAELDKIAGGELDASASNWDEVVDKMLQSATAAQKDMHSVYLDVEEYKSLRESMSGSFSGIGASLEKEEKKGAKLEIIFPDSPAEKVGLLGGDIVTAVDGVEVGEKDLNEIVKRIKGIKGTDVVLSIERGGVNIPPITVTRGDIKINNVYSKMLTPTIGYIYFSEFRGDTDKKIFAEIRKLQARGMTSLVLDVRGNPGGLVPAVSSITSEFLKDGQPIVTFKKQGQWIERKVTDGDGKFSDLPVALLVNQGSASASEILAGALQDHVEAPIVIGQRTYGKGSAQAIRPGPTGRASKLTGSKWFTPDDRAINADHDSDTGAKIEGTGGVDPDIVVEVTPAVALKIMQETYRELNGAAIVGARTQDPQLKKAIEVLGGGSPS